MPPTIVQVEHIMGLVKQVYTNHWWYPSFDDHPVDDEKERPQFTV